MSVFLLFFINSSVYVELFPFIIGIFFCLPVYLCCFLNQCCQFARHISSILFLIPQSLESWFLIKIQWCSLWSDYQNTLPFWEMMIKLKIKAMPDMMLKSLWTDRETVPSKKKYVMFLHLGKWFELKTSSILSFI